jgi:endoglucanase
MTGRNSWVTALTLAACLFLVPGSAVTTAKAASAPEQLNVVNTVSAADWDAYRTRFLDSSGRIVDNANGNISHSEGQGYGLLLAVAANDRRTFEQIWAFTFTEFMIRDDGLAAWKWDPNATPHVSDVNDASDGDILIAYALAKAGAAWSEPRFTALAQHIARAIGKTVVSRASGRPLLMPAASGFGFNERQDGPVVNLSYWIFEAFPTLAALAPEYDWNGVWREGLALLQLTNQSHTKLPSDWLSVRERARLRPADGFPPEFGYNSLRIPLYLLRAGLTETEWLKSVKQRWLGNEGVAVVDVITGQVRERLNDQGYRAMAAAMACALDQTRVPDALKTFEPNLYYPATLYLLSMSLIGEKYPQCL